MINRISRRPRFALATIVATLFALSSVGCEPTGSSTPTTATTSSTDPASTEQETQNASNSAVESRPMNSGNAASNNSQQPGRGIRVTSLGGNASRSTRPTQDQALDEDAAVSRLMEQFEQYAAQDRVVVAWLFDQSVQSEGLARAAAGSLIDYYDSHPDCKVEVLIAGADQEVAWLLEEATADAQAIGPALDRLKFQPSPSQTFAGMQAMLEKLASYRDGQAILSLVVATGSVGDDWQQADQVAAQSRTLGAPIYVVGYPAPFGLAYLPKGMGERDDRAYGPETPEPEYIPFQLDGPGMVVMDSGFGPWGLERVSRAGGGVFLAVRPPASRFASAMTYDVRWPSDVAPRFEPGALARYAPNYDSLEEYRAERDGNKAIAALLTVARRFPMARTLQNPILEFDAKDEAALKNALDAAQQPAALLSPNLNTIADILKEGEADRAKLTNPRWQAAYDLAMGQALAAVVRVDGYNGMLAQLKTGKSFTDPKSDIWALSPADSIDTTSLMRNKLTLAKEYLQRVIDEHPGTPWAYLAELELKRPIGYEWKEIDLNRR